MAMMPEETALTFRGARFGASPAGDLDHSQTRVASGLLGEATKVWRALAGPIEKRTI